MTSQEKFPLIDATEPNLIEETFDYALPPLIKFDGPLVEHIDGKVVEVHETAPSPDYQARVVAGDQALDIMTRGRSKQQMETVLTIPTHHLSV